MHFGKIFLLQIRSVSPSAIAGGNALLVGLSFLVSVSWQWWTSCIMDRCLTQQVNIIRFVHDDYTSTFIWLRDDDVFKSFQLLYSPLKWFWWLRWFALDVIRCDRSKGRGGFLSLTRVRSSFHKNFSKLACISMADMHCRRENFTMYMCIVRTMVKLRKKHIESVMANHTNKIMRLLNKDYDVDKQIQNISSHKLSFFQTLVIYRGLKFSLSQRMSACYS